MLTQRTLRIGVLGLGAAAILLAWPRAQFVVGGALVNLGYRMQDHLHSYDFEHHDEITPEQVWQEFLDQNAMAARVRSWFPRATFHPPVALLVCMDARIDTNELVGDTRRNYYVVRTAGSALETKEEEMLELAVANGVKVLVLTRHTDCAAEKAAADPAARIRFPALAAAMDAREARIEEFLARPAIAARVASGKLLVKRATIDTGSERLVADGMGEGTVPRADP